MPTPLSVSGKNQGSALFYAAVVCNTSGYVGIIDRLDTG